MDWAAVASLVYERGPEKFGPLSLIYLEPWTPGIMAADKFWVRVENAIKNKSVL